MSSFKKTATATLAALALTAPAMLANPATATAASPAQTSAPTSLAAGVAAKPRVRIALSFSRGYQHFMQTPDTVKIKVSGVKKGKAKISVDGSSLGSKSLKRGKASVTLPLDLAVGKHVVKVKVGKASAKKSITVYSGGVMASATTFTYSKTAFPSGFDMTGNVTWKGKAATEGFVDIYKAPYQKGSDSPDYMCMTSILDNAGSFHYNFCSGFDKLPEGTYQFQAFYTPDSDYETYVTGAPFTVTIVP